VRDGWNPDYLPHTCTAGDRIFLAEQAERQLVLLNRGITRDGYMETIVVFVVVDRRYLADQSRTFSRVKGVIEIRSDCERFPGPENYRTSG
jgi:hypothetical protein